MELCELFRSKQTYTVIELWHLLGEGRRPTWRRWAADFMNLVQDKTQNVDTS